MANAPGTAVTGLMESEPSRVLFARTGWMTYYAGPQAGDERPRGGGAYNRENIGHEIFNFADFNGRLYGFVRAKNGRVSLERIDPSVGNAAKLDDALVVFIARQRIVGWYSHAMIHRTSTPFPSVVLQRVRGRLKQAGARGFKSQGFRFEVSKENAVLLPTRERTHVVPGNVKGGFGQSNVCYVYQKNGKRKADKWTKEAISYVLNYGKENLLDDPTAESHSDEAAAISQEQAAGFQSNAATRRAVEDYAMVTAQKVLKDNGYSNFQNTSRLKPYDYTCARDGKTFFVEVKGTQTSGRSVILTRGEVDHVRSKLDECILVIVRSVRVSGRKKISVSGGSVEVFEPWRLEQGDVLPIQYMWTIR